MRNEFNDKTIGRNIKNRRNDMSMTQQQLADEVGVTIQTIQKYESAKVAMSFPLLVNIAEVLDCHVYDLIDMPYNLNLKKLSSALKKAEDLLVLMEEKKDINFKARLIDSYYSDQGENDG